MTKWDMYRRTKHNVLLEGQGVVLEAAYVERRNSTLIAGRLQKGCSAYFGWLFALNQYYISRHRPPEYDAHIRTLVAETYSDPYGGSAHSILMTSG